MSAEDAVRRACTSHVDGRDLLREVCENAHHIDIIVRRNGQDERLEGDWLKRLHGALNPPKKCARCGGKRAIPPHAGGRDCPNGYRAGRWSLCGCHAEPCPKCAP